jgi:hypothetical protein
MVRDAYSAGVQPQQADASTANLTQELAQLLAQSIAQGQPGKRPPGAAATGSELASLAALVSASQGQRGQPFKDGLASLAYARPMHVNVPTLTPVLAPAAAPALLVTEPQHEDEPMPIPSTWRQPTVSDDDRWYRQQLGAAALGLIAGLIVVVPAVLWLSGYLGGPQGKAPRAQAAEPSVQMAPVKLVPAATATPATKESSYAMASTTDSRPEKAEPGPAPMERMAVSPPAPPRAEPPARSRTADLMAEAKRLIESNDIRRARELLEVPEINGSAPMTFMLAETYDPNMLASWQTKGITANPEKARSLYQRARDLGDSRAAQRLDWLTAN